MQASKPSQEFSSGLGFRGLRRHRSWLGDTTQCCFRVSRRYPGIVAEMGDSPRFSGKRVDFLARLNSGVSTSTTAADAAIYHRCRPFFSSEENQRNICPLLNQDMSGPIHGELRTSQWPEQKHTPFTIFLQLKCTPHK
jgi:hypothetical protein